MDIENIEIHDFMIHKLKLKGASLFVYAIIRQCTIKDGNFSGSLKDLSDLIGISRMYCCQILKKLVDDGLITKSFRNNNANEIDYKAIYL